MRQIINFFYLRWRRTRIKKIILLHRVLRKKYTDTKTFSSGQVKSVYDIAMVKGIGLEYAYALYLSKSDFQDMYKNTPIGGQYCYLRNEISEIFFKGKSSLVGAEGVTDDLEKLNKYSPQPHDPISSTIAQ